MRAIVEVGKGSSSVRRRGWRGKKENQQFQDQDQMQYE